MVTDDAASGQAQQETVAKAGRIQSEIEFPYSDLETAVDLARALHSNAGSSCEDAELAAWLDQSINGGTYRARRSAARMFGLIEIAQGRLSLTPLGHRVVDTTEGRAARADAFLLPDSIRACMNSIAGRSCRRRQRSSVTWSSWASRRNRKVARGRCFRSRRNMLAMLIPAAVALFGRGTRQKSTDRSSQNGDWVAAAAMEVIRLILIPSFAVCSRGCRNLAMSGRKLSASYGSIFWQAASN